jgi:hypothetical protein
MMHPIRTARALCQEVLGIACVLDDVRATVRSFRATKAETKKLAAADRTAELAAARRGCTHSPACPLATAEDRGRAETVYRDGQFTYLCNGLVLSTPVVPDVVPCSLGTTKPVETEEVRP